MTQKQCALLTILLALLLVIPLHAQQASLEKPSSLRCMGLEKITTPNSIPEALEQQWVVNEGYISIMARPHSAAGTEALRAELVKLGLKDIKTRTFGLISGFLPIEQLPKLEACRYLKAAMPTLRNTTSVGRTENQAASAFFSDHISEKLGLDGKGIRIGIISDTYNKLGGAAQSVLDGDLPGTGNPNGFTKEVVVLRESVVRGIDEGRAMAELIHDIAPAAELYFYGALDGILEMESAVLALAEAGCDIIVDDLLSNSAPIYQDGIVAQAVDKVTADGVAYFSAAGNFGKTAFESEYRFELVDNESKQVFRYLSGNTDRLFLIRRGIQLSVELHWDDFSIFGSGRQPEGDLDIELINEATGELLASSTESNFDTGVPLERISYQNLTGEDLFALLVITRRDGVNPERITYFLGGDIVFLRKGDIEAVDEGFNGTIYGHRAAEGAITLAAMNYTLSPEFGGTPRIEDFSSYGGLPKIRNSKGERMPLEIRQKPELTAPDAVNTSFFGFQDPESDGFNNFFGTSAAAPNAAAVAALMLQVNPDLTPQDIKSILIESALDMDDPITETFDTGFDFASGYGLLQADKAIAIANGKPLVYRVEMIDVDTDTLVEIIEDDEIIDFSEVTSNVDIRFLSTNTKVLTSFLRDDAFTFITNFSDTQPFLAVDAANSFNKPWLPDTANYNLKWLALDGESSKDQDAINFSITNSNLNTAISATAIAPLKVFPNPTTSQSIVHIKGTRTPIVSSKLFNQLGLEVAQGQGNTLKIKKIPKGIYVLIAEDAKGHTHNCKISIE